MAEELKMWTVGDGGDAAPVEQASHTETENLLEETLVKNPDMLIPGLKLVGRQMPTVGGPLDLLGVDRDGRLVVFELKRGKLTREAVTQVIDYASDLEAMNREELAEHITQRSGRDGIDEIENFEDWYEDWRAQHIEKPDEAPQLSPVKMMLVGLGADVRATRMVDFLATRGVDMSLLTFHGYKHEGKTFLARQVWAEPEADEAAKGFRSGKESREERRRRRRRAIDEFAENQGVSDIFNEAVRRLELDSRYESATRRDGYTFYAGRSLWLPGHETRFNTPLSLRITRNGEMRVTFFPVSVHLCEQKFREAAQSISFQRERPSNAPRTNDVSEQWYCVLDRSGWDEHKETLFDLASAVSTAWDETERSAGSQAAQSADTD